jgi:pimeloyl-ACP methyl ester carboxylesterase
VTSTRVVLVHGTRDDASGFEAVVDLLDGIDAVTYTRRGWGDEDGDGNGASLDVHARDLLDVLGEEPSVVVGHSFGGNVAVRATLQRPDLVRALGLWETTMLWHPSWPALTADALRATIERVRAKTDGTPRQRRHRALFVAEGELALSEPHDLGALAALAVPTVVGIGEHSVPFFGEGSEAVADLVAATYVVVAGAGHLAHREAPDAFAAFVRDVTALAR